jgi:site-specific DNA recombinase
MLKNRFDATKRLRVLLYLRMSSDQQNPRSPQQQRESIETTIRRLGHPWEILEAYTDEAVSGRYVRKRNNFQRMLNDIRSGKVKADAILVDTFERFGRADEMADLRRELHHRHGVLVLTADTQFCDPTTTSGKALAAFESLRATEDNRVKAHNVLRGKRDAARQGHWPGGPPPFGYMLQSILTERNGRQEVDYCKLVPDPENAWIVKKLFDVAAAKGLGCLRLAKLFNADNSIPATVKPFNPQTVNDWLQHPIYYGELVWEQHATDVVDDRRVIRRNNEDEFIRVPGFCEPLVTREVWDAVQEIRRGRGERVRQARKARRNGGDEQVGALIPGLALTYMLSGLVCCGHCHRSMTASSSPTYTTKRGEARRYVSYGCPGYAGGICPNSTRVPEAWLREVVVSLVRQRLFPDIKD